MGEPPKHIVAACVVVTNEKDEILLIKGPRRGWEPPGGQVEAGESIRDAGIREVKEESGVDVEIVRFCGIFQNITRGVCSTIWLGKPVGGELATSEESLEVGYFALDEGLKMITWGNFRERIQMALDESKQPFYVEYRV